jgi:hypothetical protein
MGLGQIIGKEVIRPVTGGTGNLLIAAEFILEK